jgi:hypothetical protein
MLVLTEKDNGGWIGHAICTYRGCLELDQSLIETLLDGEKARLSSRTCLILEPHSTFNWRDAYPFKQTTPLSPIEKWHSVSESGWSKDKPLRATPAPVEGEPVSNQLTRGLLEIGKAMDQEDNLQSLALKYEVTSDVKVELNFRPNSEFAPGDLRVAYSETERYRKLAHAPERDEPSESSELPIELPQDRSDELARLIWKIVRDDQTITEREAWRRLREDADRKDPIYDAIGTLVEADELGLISTSGRQYTQTFTQYSFSEKTPCSRWGLPSLLIILWLKRMQC